MKKTKLLAEILRSNYDPLDRSYSFRRIIEAALSQKTVTPLPPKAGGNNRISTFKQNSCREQASNSSSPLWTKV
jgi:hypothetical protein